MTVMQPKHGSYAIDPSARKRDAKQSVRVEALGHVALFKDLSKRNLTRIDQIGYVKHLRAGDVLMTQGDPGNEMMVVIDGRAAVRRGKRKIGECGPGQCLGEMALLDKEPRSATVVALEPMRLVVIPGTDFRKLLAKMPRLTEGLLSAMSARLREANAAGDF